MFQHFVPEYLLKLAEYIRHNHNQFSCLVQLYGDDMVWIKSLPAESLSISQSVVGEVIELSLEWQGYLKLQLTRPTRGIDWSAGCFYTLIVEDYSKVEYSESTGYAPIIHDFGLCMVTGLSMEFDLLEATIGFRTADNRNGSIHFAPEKPKQPTHCPVSTM